MAIRDEVFQRAGGKCECRIQTCGHNGRCNAMLRGEWEVHRLAAGGPYVPSNAVAMCQTYHRNTPSYGAGKR